MIPSQIFKALKFFLFCNFFRVSEAISNVITFPPWIISRRELSKISKKSTLVPPFWPSMTGKWETFPLAFLSRLTVQFSNEIYCKLSPKFQRSDRRWRKNICLISTYARETQHWVNFILKSLFVNMFQTIRHILVSERASERNPTAAPVGRWTSNFTISVSLLLRFWFIHEQCVARQRRSRTAFQKKAKRISKIFFFSSFFSVCFFFHLLR